MFSVLVSLPNPRQKILPMFHGITTRMQMMMMKLMVTTMRRMGEVSTEMKVFYFSSLPRQLGAKEFLYHYLCRRSTAIR